jgi:hypothetical protein
MQIDTMAYHQRGNNMSDWGLQKFWSQSLIFINELVATVAFGWIELTQSKNVENWVNAINSSSFHTHSHCCDWRASTWSCIKAKNSIITQYSMLFYRWRSISINHETRAPLLSE